MLFGYKIFNSISQIASRKERHLLLSCKGRLKTADTEMYFRLVRNVLANLSLRHFESVDFSCFETGFRTIFGVLVAKQT